MVELLTGMQKVVLHLWFAYPGDLSDAGVAEACAALLSDAERARAFRYVFERNRREQLATHALARLALSHAYPLPPEQWSYSVNKYGKPSPIPECGLRFNQSNTVELAACLVARSMPGAGDESAGASLAAAPEVGIDVESFACADRIINLASDVFSPAERSQLFALPAAARPARAVSLWTLKEAYIKARGMGLYLPLLKISFLFGGADGLRLQVDPGVDENPSRWRFCLLNHMNHSVALVVEGSATTFEIREFRPLLAPPARLPDPKEPWFPSGPADPGDHAAG